MRANHGYATFVHYFVEDMLKLNISQQCCGGNIKAQKLLG